MNAEELRAAAQRLRDKADLIERLPKDEDCPVGTVFRIVSDFTACFIKHGKDWWQAGGQGMPNYARTYDQLIEILIPNVNSVEVGTSWKGILNNDDTTEISTTSVANPDRITSTHVAFERREFCTPECAGNHPTSSN